MGRHHLLQLPNDCLCAAQVAVLAIFFHKTAEDPGVAAAGLMSAVLGLVLFLDGLRLSIMPMAMQVRSKHMPVSQFVRAVTQGVQSSGGQGRQSGKQSVPAGRRAGNKAISAPHHTTPTAVQQPRYLREHGNCWRLSNSA